MTQYPFYSSTPSRLQIQTALESSPQNRLFRAGFPSTTKVTGTDPLHPPDYKIPPSSRQFSLGVNGHTVFWTNHHPLEPWKIHPKSPLKRKVCQKQNFLITSTTLQNHPFDFFALSETRLSPPLLPILAIKNPYGSLNKVILYYFPIISTSPE